MKVAAGDKKKLRFAVDLLWIRVQQNGGTESFARNLLAGFRRTDRDFEVWLAVSRDNRSSFVTLTEDPRFRLLPCDVDSARVGRRILWENLHLGRALRTQGLSLCLEPVYSMPITGIRGISFVTVIHDLQALHYPEYFSKIRNTWMRAAWKQSVKHAARVVATSEAVRQDILMNYSVAAERVARIPIPVETDPAETLPPEELQARFDVTPGSYYYTVSSLLPHKNLAVLMDAMKLLDDGRKLLVSGVGGPMREELEAKIHADSLENRVVLTPFVDDRTRNALYQNCAVFLFPSLFEGFGMPPVEAMLFGAPVLTTRCTSLPEVTLEEAYYVDDPKNPQVWADTIRAITAMLKTGNIAGRTAGRIGSKENPYRFADIAAQYLDLLEAYA